MSEYILKTGDAGAERLDLLNRVFSPYSQSYLLDVGLKPGMRVVELGCGTGVMTTWIAKHVGDSGHVTAIDGSKEQLDYARKMASEAGIKNITYIHSTVEEISPENNAYDLAYSRYLLMHLPDPVFALKRMHSLLKPQGILACEEPTASSLLTYPKNNVIEKLNEYFIKLGKKRGINFNIGDELLPMLINLDCKLLAPRFVQPIISIEMAKEFLILGAKEVLSVVIKENIISEQEASDLFKALQNIPNDKSAYYAFPRQAQIAGIKAI